jgi:N-acetylmuramoyl-L-alanine amidase
MKTKPSNLLLLAGVLAGLLCSLRLNAFETVVLDAGHGGNDEGTRWYHISEEDLTLAVSKKVAALLRAKGVFVVETRVDDRYLSLDDRAAVANHFPDSLLVSIHFNAVKQTSVDGFQTYHFYGSPTGRLVADTIQEALAEKLTSPNRGVLQNDYAVLARTMSAVLVECGFVSNKKEAMYYNSAEGQNTLAEALANGIMRVKAVVYHDPPACEYAKRDLYGKKMAAASRKLLLTGAARKGLKDPESEHASVSQPPASLPPFLPTWNPIRSLQNSTETSSFAALLVDALSPRQNDETSRTD